MGCGIKTSVDILNSGTSITRNMSAASSKLRQAQGDMLNMAEFCSRNELDKSGLSREHDAMQKTVLNIESQDKTTRISKSKLNNEKTALDQVKSIMVRFGREMSGNSKAVGSKQDRVNSALADLEAAFRVKNTSGLYVWGGKDQTIDPLSRIDEQGNRVSVSLVEESSIVNGLITNNYSSSDVNDRIITASSEHEIRESFLHPAHGAMAATIGYLNMIKENADAIDAGGSSAAIYTDEELAFAQRNQEEQRGTLFVEVGLESKKVEEAFKVNDRDKKNAMMQEKESFSGNIIDRAQKVRDLLVSLTASITLSNIASKIADKLSELRV